MDPVPGLDGEARHLSADELVDAWPMLSTAERVDSFEELPRGEATDFFLGLEAAEQAALLRSLPGTEHRIWMRALPPDEAADLIQAADPADRDHMLELLEEAPRKEVLALLHYAEDDAGGLMSPRFARVRPDMSVDEAIRYLRKQAREKLETLYYAYVLGPDQKLLGVVSFRELFKARPEQRVDEIMRKELVTATEEMDQEALALVFDQHKILAMPVLDAEGRMKGIVTFDDIVDVVREEATEDIQKFGGVEALDVPYFHSPFWTMIRKRVPWLVVLFFLQFFTASTMAFYESELQAAVVLSLFIPLIISSGGNAGSQASTLVIRSLALGEVENSDWFKVFVREVGAGLVLGGILGFLGLLRILLWPQSEQVYGEHFVRLGMAVGFSVAAVVLWGSLCGAMLPFLLRRLGLDPASASAPFVATLVDVTGLVVYFTVASRVLAGTLL